MKFQNNVTVYLLEDERLQNSTSAEQRLKENIYREPWRLQMSERDKTIKQPINQSINLKNVILLQNIKLFDWLIVFGFTPNRQHSSHVTAGHFLHRSCVCLFWGFTSISRIFHSNGNVTITGEGLQILTYARHSWLCICEGSLTWHAYCDMGFIMNISEDPWHSHLLPSVLKVELMVCCGWDSNTQSYTCEANALTDCATAAVL